MEAIKPEPLVEGHSTGNRGNKIALEEHFSIPALLPKPEEVSFFDPDVLAQVDSLLPDLTEERLVKMDQARIEIAVLSQTAPGMQAIADSQAATQLAIEANNVFDAAVQRFPNRFKGWAAF